MSCSVTKVMEEAMNYDIARELGLGGVFWTQFRFKSE